MVLLHWVVDPFWLMCWNCHFPLNLRSVGVTLDVASNSPAFSAANMASFQSDEGRNICPVSE